MSTSAPTAPITPSAPTAPPSLSQWSVAQTAPVLSQQAFPIQTWSWGLAAIVIIGLVVGGLVSGANSNTGNSTVVLALVTGTAVVIERLLEAFWTFEDSTKGAWWPFNLVHDQIDERVAKFGDYAQPYLNQLEWARRTLQDVHKNDADWQTELDAIGRDINALPGQITKLADQLRSAKLGNDQKLDLLLSNASAQITAVLNAHPDLQKQLGADVTLAKSLTDDIYSFTKSFQDNPARRIISLVVGCAAGFVVALVLRLDLFAALGVQAFGPFKMGATELTWGIGVPLTGLIMGLGSNPTHEVIQAIQQFKQSK